MNQETRFSFEVMKTNIKAVVYIVCVVFGGVIGYIISEYNPDNLLNMLLSLLSVIVCSGIGVAIAPFCASWVVWQRSKNLPQKDKDECLYEAAANGDVRSVKRFLAIGADVNCVVYEPIGNPLDYAYAFGFTKKSPLDVAINPEVRQVLLEHGAKNYPDQRVHYLK